MGPLVGGALAALVYTKLLEPMHIKCTNNSDLPCDPDARHCSHSADEPCDKVVNKMIDFTDKQM